MPDRQAGEQPQPEDSNRHSEHGPQKAQQDGHPPDAPHGAITTAAAVPPASSCMKFPDTQADEKTPPWRHGTLNGRLPTGKPETVITTKKGSNSSKLPGRIKAVNIGTATPPGQLTLRSMDLSRKTRHYHASVLQIEGPRIWFEPKPGRYDHQMAGRRQAVKRMYVQAQRIVVMSRHGGETCPSTGAEAEAVT